MRTMNVELAAHFTTYTCWNTNKADLSHEVATDSCSLELVL